MAANEHDMRHRLVVYGAIVTPNYAIRSPVGRQSVPKVSSIGRQNVPTGKTTLPPCGSPLPFHHLPLLKQTDDLGYGPVALQPASILRRARLVMTGYSG